MACAPVVARPDPTAPGCIALTAALTDAAALRAVLGGLDVKNVFIAAWSRRANEVKNIRVNGAIVGNVLAAVGPALAGGHVGLVIGLKH